MRANVVSDLTVRRSQVLLLPQVPHRAFAVQAQLAPRDGDFLRRLVEIKQRQIFVFRFRNVGDPGDLIASHEEFPIMRTLLVDGQNLFVRQ